MEFLRMDLEVILEINLELDLKVNLEIQKLKWIRTNVGLVRQDTSAVNRVAGLLVETIGSSEQHVETTLVLLWSL